jgi:two-component system, LytTR family, response regulator
MATALIIDDETRSINVLSGLLKQYCPSIEVTGTTNDPEKAIELIRQEEPQLVFLDIRMPALSGFDVLDHFDPPPFRVIFTTAYNTHAIQAIKHEAFDYLLKPIIIEELKASVARFEKWAAQNDLRLPDHNPDIPSKIPISSRNGYNFIDPENVIWVEASESYTVFHMRNKKQIVASCNLKKYEDILDPKKFLRIHHSHIINIEHLDQYIRAKHPYVIMSDGKQLDISLRKRSVLSRVLHI